MIQLLYGNEPYVIQKRKQKVVNALNNKQMNLQTFEGKFDQEVYDACAVYPFLENKRVIVLDVENLSVLDTPLFEKYLSKPVSTTDLVIICRNIDKRVKLFKRLNSKKIAIACDKLDDELLKKTLLCELSHRGANIQEIAMAEFIKRLNYHNEESVNLISMVGFIDNMVSVDKNITLQMVEQYVPKYEEPNVFALSKLLLADTSDALLKEVSMIDSEQSIQTLSLLLRDFRIAYKLKYFDKSALADKPGAIFSSFTDKSVGVLVNCMEIITDTISDIKAGRITNELALKSAGVKLFNTLK